MSQHQISLRLVPLHITPPGSARGPLCRAATHASRSQTADVRDGIWRYAHGNETVAISDDLLALIVSAFFLSRDDASAAGSF